MSGFTQTHLSKLLWLNVCVKCFKKRDEVARDDSGSWLFTFAKGSAVYHQYWAHAYYTVIETTIDLVGITLSARDIVENSTQAIIE